MYYIDRGSPVPIYYQVKTHLRDRIKGKEWGLNQKLPTETELAQYYGISRITLRQAVTELENEGLLIKKRGQGTFVNEKKTPIVTTLSYSLSSRAGSESIKIETTVLEQMKLTQIEPYVRKRLELQENEAAIYIKRLFSIDGTPMAVSRSYLPAHLVPDLEHKALVNNSISLSLQKYYQIEPMFVKDNLAAVRATQSESRILAITLDSPLMLVEGLSYYAEKKPLESSHTLWAGDSVQFEILLHKGENGFKPFIADI